MGQGKGRRTPEAGQSGSQSERVIGKRRRGGKVGTAGHWGGGAQSARTPRVPTITLATCKNAADGSLEQGHSAKLMIPKEGNGGRLRTTSVNVNYVTPIKNDRALCYGLS